ncbi:hypothetical protein Tco_1502235 [Tanacetum coccineum]
MSTRTPLTQEEAEREALAISICERYSILEEERPVIETMTYSDKYKKILDGICLDKMKLDGMNKEEEEAIIKIKGEALIEKDNPGAFLGREEVQNVKKGISTLNHSKAEPLGLRSNVLCQVGVTIIIAKFIILDMPIDKDTPILVGRGFLHTCGGILNTIDNITSTFDGICHQTFRAAKTRLNTVESDSDNEEEKICVWKKVISFLGSLPVVLQHVEWKPDYTGCFNKKEDSDGQWYAEIRLTDPYGYRPRFRNKEDNHEISKVPQTMGGNDDEAESSRPKRFRQYETVEEVLLPQVHYEFLEWEGCNRDAKTRMGYSEEIDGMLRINLCKAGTNEEIFTYVAWIRAFNINEPIYQNFATRSTHEFDEVCADDELKTKKIIKFILGGRAYSLTLLEFSHRLGLYHVEELDEEDFDVYFQGGLRSDEHFNAQEYLDTTTLRELIDSEGRLIPKAPQSDIPRVSISRSQRASMQDLDERMGSMEIRQGAIERMSYRQSYHWDRYAGVFEHMAEVYNVPLQGVYNPLRYAQPQADHYYQQYPLQKQ